VPAASAYGGAIVNPGRTAVQRNQLGQELRAFDKSSGELLWQATLPFPGNATPATYAVMGGQYLVIAAGGGKDPKSGSGGVYVAFILPTQNKTEH
jgi:quinoprotein glucose dehydrogenase